ncbi:MAG TPA: phosphoribosylamine--glycine ligase [Candidatus Eisenbacteria bacterium]|nr:phosphoribosylamine--glycine ligase [Candidatus Eisenbacteria bacterium]
MKLLVVGSGGREHALVWKIAQSPEVEKVYCAPGSAGIGELAECIEIQPEEIDRLADCAHQKRIDLTVVGPELPLALGIADVFQARGLKLFGPNRAAARLEASKAFAKQILRKYRIPTASFEIHTDPSAARRHLARQPGPSVVKADGLAAGKGVFVCADREEAERAIEEILVRKSFGSAGERVVIEELLEGEEASFMALTDGEHLLPLAPSQDHKRLLDGDLGPNTGGMGAYSPAPVVTSQMHRRIMGEILEPLLLGLKNDGILYRGVIYAGLMITDTGPKVLEFNVRFGDPECQPIMMRLENDLVPLLEAAAAGTLDRVTAVWRAECAVTVVACARGYPGAYEKGKEIHGLETLRDWQKGFVFHAGTAREGDRWVTAGGRVLALTARGATIADAVNEVYRAIGGISWDGMHYRRDIAHRALRRQ